MENQYTKLRAIDVSKYVEKKSNLSYLSWSWAVDQLLQNDPMATWEYQEPRLFGTSMMVYCSVTAFGKTMTAQLPVMDHKNKALANPDACDVNKAMQRALAKAIALHGIGLYIYSGEDLPDASLAPPEPTGMSESTLADYLATIDSASTLEALKKAYTTAKTAAEAAADRDAYKAMTSATNARKAALEAAAQPAYAEQA